MDTRISFEYFYYCIKDMDFDEQKEQIRALWTAYCFLNHIECDTFTYDTNLRDIYDHLNNSSKFKTFDEFDEYICQLVI